MSVELVGEKYRFDLGQLKIDYQFDSETQATFVVVDGGGLAPDGHTETVTIDLKQIRDGVFLSSWTEASGATISHVEDFENGTLYSNLTMNGTLYNFVGTIEKLD